MKLRLTWLALAIVWAGSGVAMATPTADDPFAGRLGGTVAAFEAEHGAAVGADRSGRRYEVAGFGLVVVGYDDGADGLDDADRARVILLSPPQLADIAGSGQDTADWSLAEARRRALRFLPRDAELGEEIVLTEASLGVECRSAALGALFAAERRGSCLVTLTTTTDGGVSLVRLTHTGGDPSPAATPGSDPCAGIVDWAAATAARIEAAADLLAAVGAIAEDDPQAAAELGRLGEGFARLAAEQREETTPRAADDATYFLIRAFNAYASAMEDAAAALKARNTADLDRAVAAIGQADASAARGTEALREAFDACGVEVATPAP